MTRIGAETGGVNLAQGLPDFAPPPELLEALPRVFAEPSNHQYSFTWGSPEFRRAVAEKCARFNSLRVDPDAEVTITCGVSEAGAAPIGPLRDPGRGACLLQPPQAWERPGRTPSAVD